MALYICTYIHIHIYYVHKYIYIFIYTQAIPHRKFGHALDHMGRQRIPSGQAGSSPLCYFFFNLSFFLTLFFCMGKWVFLYYSFSCVNLYYSFSSCVLCCLILLFVLVRRVRAEQTLQHMATHCNTLQHTATHCNTLQHTATHCNTLQHTATHCNALQHTATHCNTLHHLLLCFCYPSASLRREVTSRSANCAVFCSVFACSAWAVSV